MQCSMWSALRGVAEWRAARWGGAPTGAGDEPAAVPSEDCHESRVEAPVRVALPSAGRRQEVEPSCEYLCEISYSSNFMCVLFSFISYFIIWPMECVNLKWVDTCCVEDLKDKY